MRSVPLLGALVASLAFAGCATGSDSGEALAVGAGDLTDPRFDDSSGAIDGVVTDEALAPLSGAVVRLEGGSAEFTTGADGRFVFSYVPPGPARLSASLLGYEDGFVGVSVSAGAVTRASLRLVALPSAEAFHATQRSDGRMLCAADTKPQRFVLNFCGSLMFVPVESGEKSFGKYPLAEPGVSKLMTLVFETTWAATQATGRGLDVYWEAFQEITDPTTFPEGAPRRFARVNGTSPLWAMANETVIDEILSADPPSLHCHAGERCTVMSRTFPRATTLGASSPVDAALYLDQRFTHYLTEFHGLAAPADYSVLPDS